MKLPRPLSQMLCSLLAVLLVVTALPAWVPTALGAPEGALVGSLSAIGSVELRGVAVSRDGTVFSGDTIRTWEDGYRKRAGAGTRQRLSTLLATCREFQLRKSGTELLAAARTLGLDETLDRAG